MKILGIDEAGRGPVIGPLVIAAVVIDEDKEVNLKRMGVKDSKLLGRKKREELFHKIIKFYEFKFLIIPPSEIDDALASETLNLNWLEAQKSAILINELKPGKAILDCPSPNLKRYKEYVKEILKSDTELIVEHKADFNHPVVAAASIIAKVIRDDEISKIQKGIKENIGSGYIADPATQRFLDQNHDKYPEIIRKSWSSYTKSVNRRLQKNLGDF
ncbi:MAG: ribonuclease HII [Candidatus Woesearchaeota archaeon]